MLILLAKRFDGEIFVPDNSYIEVDDITVFFHLKFNNCEKMKNFCKKVKELRE